MAAQTGLLPTQPITAQINLGLSLWLDEKRGSRHKLTRDIFSARRNASQLKHEIAELVEPYMMLDHISVSRPRKLQPRLRKGLFAAGDTGDKHSPR